MLLGAKKATNGQIYSLGFKVWSVAVVDLLVAFWERKDYLSHLVVHRAF